MESNESLHSACSDITCLHPVNSFKEKHLKLLLLLIMLTLETADLGFEKKHQLLPQTIIIYPKKLILLVYVFSCRGAKERDLFSQYMTLTLLVLLRS